MKKLLLVLVTLFLVGNVLADSQFNISMGGPLKAGNEIIVQTNLTGIKTLNFKASGIIFPKKTIDNNTYHFVIPDKFKIDPTNKHIELVVTKQDNSTDTYIYDKFFPDFEYIDLTDLYAGKQANLVGDFTGNCALYYSGDKSFSISSNKGNYYVTIPDQIPNKITGGYIKCDGLSSNYKTFYIPASPTLLYVVSANKQAITPGSKLILVGKNLRLPSQKEVKLLLNGKEISFKFIDDNHIEFTLPNIQLQNATLQLLRNGFKSNTINISAIEPIFLKYVDVKFKDGKPYFRLYGNFSHFKLGSIQVNFDSRTLSILSTGTINGKDYIDVAFPKYTQASDGTFSCDWYLTNGYFQVKVGNIDSNKLFYTPSVDTYITKIELPNCDNVGCYVKFYLNKNPGKFQYYLNDELIPASSLGNLVRLQTKGIVPKGQLYFINNFCIKSPVYYFDFTDDFKPYIQYIESKDYFKPQGEFTIIGTHLTRDNSNQPIDLKINFEPNDVIEKVITGFDTIKGQLKYGIQNGKEVKVSISTKYGQGNGGYFVIGGKKLYLGNPLINNILYPDGGQAGNKVIIKGVGFSPNCYENKIYFGDKVIYPQDCSYTKLIFEIPSDVTSNKISVEVNGKKSNDFALNTTLGGLTLEKNIKIYGTFFEHTINLNKATNSELNFHIINPKSDIYISELKFILKGLDYFPLNNLSLFVNNDNTKYYFSFDDHKILKTDQKLVPIVKKINGGYEIVFRGVYVPFSINPIPVSLKFDISKNLPNKTSFSLSFPSQKIYYHNIFSSDEKVSETSIDNSFSSNYLVLNPVNVCFDSTNNFENCSLVLAGGKLNVKNDENENAKIVSNQKITNNTKSVSKRKTVTLSKQEKIAKRLTLQKMKLLNYVLRKFLIQMKNKYWTNKEKLKYVVQMYKGYKIMVANTSDDWDKKLKYVDGLIYFAKVYFSFMTPGLKK